MSVEIYANIVVREALEGFNPKYHSLNDDDEFEVISFGRPDDDGWIIWEKLKDYSTPIADDQDLRILQEDHYDDIADLLESWSKTRLESSPYNINEKRDGLAKVLRLWKEKYPDEICIFRFSH